MTRPNDIAGASLGTDPERFVLLVVDNLACRRNERELFHSLSFQLANGGAIRLVGPNGAGKTSLLRILAGLLSGAEGTARAPGESEDIPLPEHSSFVSVRGGLKSALTVIEHLGFWRSFASRAPQNGVDIVLDQWGLQDLAETPAAWLSSGQRRRLELARLSCENRRVWLVDEPLNALDDPSAELFHAAVADFRRAGGGVIAASHQALPWPDLQEIALGPAPRRRPTL